MVRRPIFLSAVAIIFVWVASIAFATLCELASEIEPDGTSSAHITTNSLENFVARSVAFHLQTPPASQSSAFNANQNAIHDFVNSFGFDAKTCEAYARALGPQKAGALKSAILSISDYHPSAMVKGADALKRAKLYDEAITFYRWALQYAKIINLYREELNRADLADALAQKMGVSDFDKKAMERLDFIGTIILDHPESDLRFHLSSQRIPQSAHEKIFSSFNEGRLIMPTAREQATPIPLQPTFTPAEIAKAAGVNNLQTIQSTKQLLNAMIKHHATQFPNKQLFMMAIGTSQIGVPLIGGRGVFGGKYAQGESVYINYKFEVLNRPDYHLTPKWGTHGSKTEESIDPTDRKALYDFFVKSIDGTYSLNEVVFLNSAGLPVTFDDVQSIWIHPFFRRKFLQNIEEKNIPPPVGRSWEDVILSRVYAI